ncbi:L-aspartate oxidase [Seleniivibrio woodruffii]|uniref:L-aspartate oxidase n=1 Tax=Seleniivibrio woodruffii TaxID=1078050 RepID=UPI002409B085|nr:L-aspartate oxidase [Seleniivibrio woodruffii]
MKTFFYDYIVLGSGVAGLRAAIELAGFGSVAVVTKCFLGESSSEYAQGGVAVALSDDDDISLHIEDTLRAGDGLCDMKAVSTLVEQGPKYIKQLISWGAKFDMHGGVLEFSREAAHSVNRIIHAKGDATGHEIVRTLKEYSKNFGNIEKIEYTYAIDFIKDAPDSVCGVFALDEKTGEFKLYYAKAVIVATGGAGRLYRRTTNPAVVTGDGMAMAFRAGADMRDMEFYQFHPTGLSVPGAPAFLLSEAMRGEGGILRNVNMERFAAKYHPDGELAPRDVVSRAIFFEMKQTGSDHVFLDLTHLEKDFVRNRFPKIYTTCLEYNIDITVNPIPVSPAAHYYMGGIFTDEFGRSSLKGLYACGEAACNGVHGANRLASNSLLEGVVYGGRSAETAAADTMDKKVHAVELAAFETVSEEHADTMVEKIQECMWDCVGVSRNSTGLARAKEYLGGHLTKYKNYVPVDRNTAEIRNMLTVGLLMANAADERKGSRGGHYRDDYPDRIADNWHIYFHNAEFNPVKN